MNHRYLVLSVTAAMVFMVPAAERREKREVEAKVVATKTLHQTGVLPDTTIFTPTNDANFRISLYLTLPSMSGAFLGIDARWTDENGTFNASSNQGGVFLFASGPSTTGSIAQATYFVHAKANTPIQVYGLNAGDSRTDTTSPYTVYVVLEEMPELQEHE